MNANSVNRSFLIASTFLFFCSYLATGQELRDKDGNSYKTVKYGKQEWMASNLNVTHFRNGDAIPEVKTAEEWMNAAKEGKPACCAYENDTANASRYGRLYNWFAVNDKRGLAPEGWHVAINADWSMLVKNLLGIDYAGAKLKSVADWKAGTGNDKIGFKALPGGFRDAGGKFMDLGKKAQFWSNSVPVDVKPSDKIYSFALSNNTVECQYLQVEKGMGLSIRCEKD
jgi:uncharacterized protein (TIGR02145 family)